MARRLPSTPPTLAGFSYVRVLGSGGFADVFLYEQNLPRRPVAVKVMLSEVVTAQVRQMFQAEANLMAQLSAHPSVLTVYQASVAPDGRPYLVMELCSPSIGQRFRSEPMQVADVLGIGVSVSSAVETAHRAGVLHRDVKPSNILTTAYGHPVLSDFGIAATLGEAELSEAVGLSVPWSAPEVLLDETPGTVASEVWALGATLYSLLAGRSPFEVAGAQNTTAELISRIQRAKPEPIGRVDVPARFEAILRRSMSRKPEARQRSVLEFIRDLQSIESELGLAQTPIEVAVDDWVALVETDEEDRTRVTGIGAVDPGSPAGSRRRRPPRPAVEHGQSAAAPGGEAARVESGAALSGGRGTRRLSRGTAWLIAACCVLAVAFVVTVAVVVVRATGSSEIPTVRNVAGATHAGTIEFTWPDPGIATGDSYQVSVDNGTPSLQHGREFRVDAGGEQVCVTVSVNRDGKVGDASSPACVDPRSSR